MWDSLPGLTYDYTIAVVDSNSFVSDTSNVVYATVSGGTTVISNITSNTTWTKANSPYKVVSSIAVASGATLTIQPGVTVQLDLGVGITVNGVLKAIGTSVDSIRFTTLAVCAGLQVNGSICCLTIRACRRANSATAMLNLAGVRITRRFRRAGAACNLRSQIR